MAAPAVTRPVLTPGLPRTGEWLKTGLLAALGVAGLAIFLVWDPPDYRPLGTVQAARFLLGALTYLAAARAVLYLKSAGLRAMLFAVINVAAIGLFFDMSDGRRRFLFLLAAYLSMVSFHYVMMRLFARRAGWWPWMAFASPIAALVVLRYAAALFDPVFALVPGILTGPLAAFFIGLSYMAFRLSHLVLEVRNGGVARPGFWQYLGFAFFLPTLVVGPINPYSNHAESLGAPDRTATPIGRCLLRILMGAAKYQFLGNIFNQLSYAGLLLDGYPHSPVDLFVAAVAYHLYLYCNFSGFCDMAIGGAGLLGIQVKENFRNPLGARNVQDYWTRWHITLSTYMRDVLFSPLSKFLVVRLGPKRANHAIAAVILFVFLLVGIWHGTGANFAVYGALHGLGVASVHYYNVWLKTRLGKQRYKAYHESRLVHAVAVAMTFLFVTASLFFFANDFETARQILHAIQ